MSGRSDRWKVVHAPLEIAGQVGLICELLRGAGLHAVGYNYFTNYLNYRGMIETDSYGLVKLLDHLIEFYDLFHFHNGYTFLEDARDIEMIRDAGKPIIMHHRGNDVRSRKRARKWKNYENPYVNAESSLPDEVIDRNLKYFAKHVSAAIVQDHELLPYVEDYYAAEGKPVYVLPRLFRIDDSSPGVSGVWKARRRKRADIATDIANQMTDQKDLADEKDRGKGREVWIVHAPTQRQFKGTDFILQAIEKLKGEMPIQFRLIEGMSHDQAMSLYRQADIIIDQILCGAYGNLSIEGMALGKTVVCYVRPDLVWRYPPELPIASANPDTIYDVLKELVRNHELRKELGSRGRDYVRKYHNADTVIRTLLSIYDNLLTNGGHS